MHNDAKNFLFSNEVIQVSRIVSELIGIKKKSMLLYIITSIIWLSAFKTLCSLRVRIQFYAALLCAVIA